MTYYTNSPIPPEKAKELLSLDTEYKEIITYGKIEEWYTAWEDRCYIVDHQIPLASVYGDIVASDGENDYDATLMDCPLHCTGCQRTGCMFCSLGAHLEKSENRFERMKHTHPKHYAFCIGGGEYDPADGLWKPTAAEQEKSC